jgi:hypothetical protein
MTTRYVVPLLSVLSLVAVQTVDAEDPDLAAIARELESTRRRASPTGTLGMEKPRAARAGGLEVSVRELLITAFEAAQRAARGFDPEASRATTDQWVDATLDSIMKLLETSKRKTSGDELESAPAKAAAEEHPLIETPPEASQDETPVSVDGPAIEIPAVEALPIGTPVDSPPELDSQGGPSPVDAVVGPAGAEPLISSDAPAAEAIVSDSAPSAGDESSIAPESEAAIPCDTVSTTTPIEDNAAGVPAVSDLSPVATLRHQEIRCLILRTVTRVVEITARSLEREIDRIHDELRALQPVHSSD